MRLQITYTVFTLIFFGSFACEHSISTGPDPTPSGNPTTFTKIQSDVFTLNCALSGCHGDTQNPRLNDGQAYGNIVNKASSQGLNYIEPGDPDNSYLYKKITGTQTAGARMPRGEAPLPTALIDSVRSWIERGAPND